MTATRGAWCCAGSTRPRPARYGKASFAGCRARQRARRSSTQFVRRPPGRRHLGAPQRQPRVVGVHANGVVRLLLTPVGVERDRVRRPAYPRGFMRLGGATGHAAVREPFETRGATDEDPVRVVKGGEP